MLSCGVPGPRASAGGTELSDPDALFAPCLWRGRPPPRLPSAIPSRLCPGARSPETLAVEVPPAAIPVPARRPPCEGPVLSRWRVLCTSAPHPSIRLRSSRRCPFPGDRDPLSRPVGPAVHRLASLCVTLTLALQIPLARAGAWPCLVFGLGETTLLLGAIWLLAAARTGARPSRLPAVASNWSVLPRPSPRLAPLPVFGLHVIRTDDPITVAKRSPWRAWSRIEIGRDLSPDERPSLAQALTDAVGDAGGSPRLRIETRRSLLEHLSPGEAR